MATDTELEKELRAEIDREIHTLMRRAEDENGAMLARTREECESRKRMARQRLREELAMRGRRAQSKAELEGRNLLLRAHREEIDRIFEIAAEELRRMETTRPEDFAELLWTVFCSCRSMVPGSTVRVRLGTGTKLIYERLAGEKGVEIESSDAFTGLLVESSDGHIHCDGSLDAILYNLRREKEAELEAALFDERPDDDN